MAIIDKSKTVAQLNNKIELPRDRYLCQCISEQFGPSQGGNPMITRKWQLVSPEQKEINGQNVVIAGTEFVQYLVVKNMVGDEKNSAEEKTAKSQARLLEDYKRLGFGDLDIDDENPKLIAKGIFADCICGSEESQQRKQPTPEQKAQRKMGDPILDSNGKPIVTYRPVLLEVLGVAEKPSGGASL